MKSLLRMKSNRLREIFANHISHKRLASRICKEVSKLNKKMNNLFFKNEQSYEETFHQKRYSDGK